MDRRLILLPLALPPSLFQCVCRKTTIHVQLLNLKHACLEDRFSDTCQGMEVDSYINASDCIPLTTSRNIRDAAMFMGKWPKGYYSEDNTADSVHTKMEG